MRMGNERDARASVGASFYYNINNLGTGYDQSIIDKVTGYWGQLKSECESTYNQKLKQLNK